MKKKLLSAALILSVCAIMFSNMLVSGQAEPTMKVSQVSGAPGNTVEVAISLENNPGIIDAKLKVAYDSNLTLTNAVDAKVLNDSVFSNDLTQNPYIMTWDDALATSNNAGNGTIATLTFKISSTCASGTYNVSVTYDKDDVYDKDMNDVSFTVVNGGVTVNAPTTATTETTATVVTTATTKTTATSATTATTATAATTSTKAVVTTATVAPTTATTAAATTAASDVTTAATTVTTTDSGNPKTGEPVVIGAFAILALASGILVASKKKK